MLRFMTSSRYTYVFVARNYRGELSQARSNCKEGKTTPKCAEAMCIREVSSWIKRRQLQRVVVETDCLVSVQAIRDSATMSSYFGVIVQECGNLLMEVKDKGVILKFVKRFANSLAHAFVNYGNSVGNRIWKANDVSLEIIHVLDNDLN